MFALRSPAFASLAAVCLLSSVLFSQTPSTESEERNSGRQALSRSLNAIAEGHLSARKTVIASITTRAQAETRQREVRAKIVALMGGLPAKTPLHARVTGSTTADGFRMEKVLFESQPGYRVTAILYLPESSRGKKVPAIVVAPGHGATGKMGDYFFASAFARNGFAVLS